MSQPTNPLDLEHIEYRLLTEDGLGKDRSITDPLIAEIRSLREGVQDAIKALQEEKDHWQAQADRMADPGKSTAGAYYLGIVKGLEKACGFLPAEGGHKGATT